MVTYSQGTSAVPVIAEINGATNIVSQVNALSAAQAVISGVSFSMPTGNFNTGDPLTISESATLWNAIFTIYNNRLTNYDTTLAAI